MNFLDNLVISLCFTFNLCDRGQVLFIRPSLSLMPEKVFTNQANYERVKGKNSIKEFNRWVTIYDGRKKFQGKKNFRLGLPVPDLVLPRKSANIQPGFSLLNRREHLIDKPVSLL